MYKIGSCVSYIMLALIALLPEDGIACGRSSMAEQKLPKLTTGVRFPSPAPIYVIYVKDFHNVGSCVRSLRLRRTNHQYRLLV